MTINSLTVSQPYYDDFDETKGFHQILFKPGYAVQARELTGLQSILREQISKFGKHIFQQGSVVIPGNVNAELNTPFIKIAPGTPDLLSWVGKTVIGLNAAGVRAVVKHVELAADSDPDILYLVYTMSGGATGINTFADSEVVAQADEDGDATGTTVTLAASSSIGSGSLAHINKGVFFVNGNFVYVGEQTIAISKTTTTPSCHVMLKIVESIVDSDMDESLLDPSNGSFNYNAPGADRLKIDLVLTSISLDSTVTEDYVELMRFNTGVMEVNNRYAQYSELEKTLARRTFDESGDYRVSGFDLTVRDHKRTQYNSGLSEDGDQNKFVCDFSSGKAYLQGHEVEKIYDSRIVLDKGRTSDHVKVKSVSIQNNYGRFLYASSIVRLPDFHSHEIVNLYNYSGGTLVGTARVIGLDYFDGTPTAPGAVYKLFIHDIVLTGAYTLSDIGYFVGTVTTTATGLILQRLTVPNASLDFTVGEIVQTAAAAHVATVKFYARSTSDLYVFKHSATATPEASEIITGVTSSSVATIRSIENAAVVGGVPIFTIPADSIKSVKNSSNLYDTAYTVIKSFTITTNGSGNGSFTASGGTFLSPEAGNTIITGPAGVVSVNTASVTSGVTFNLTGLTATTTYYITSQFNKTAGQPKTKSKQTVTLTGISPAYSIALTKCDVYKLTSVVDVSGNDWTSKYILDGGQTDYYYGLGSLLFNGSALPLSNLTIVFEYFTHSAGDYFTADSYTTLEVVGGSFDYLPLIPSYRSKTTSTIYSLRNQFDFRPRIGESDSFTDSVVPSSATVTSIQYYVPRVDIIYINTSKTIDAVRGEPADVPKLPVVADGALPLFRLFIPAYTNSIDDIIVVKEKNQRYTMKDISKLEDRIANTEYFSTLNASEQSLLTFEVVDSVTGLNRFKTGFLVDNFSNPFTVCDYYNPLSGSQFRAQELTPAIESHESSFIIDSGSSSNYQVTGGQITMPYTEVAFISQATSTRVTNINHFLLISWEGQLTITPPIDNWVDTENLPQIFTTVNNTVIVTREDHVPVFDPAPAEPAQTPTPAPINISLNNSLAWAGATGQTVFSVPASAVHQVAGGVWALNSNITEDVARNWVVDQYTAGLTHTRVAGETSNSLVLNG